MTTRRARPTRCCSRTTAATGTAPCRSCSSARATSPSCSSRPTCWPTTRCSSRAVKVLTTDVCQDVEVIGWLYQFYISERKDEVFAGFKKNKKAGADEIPAATQLFTPHWIVRYLVENSLGRLWMLNRPASRLVDQMDYYIAPVDEETDFLKITSPEELKVFDPACGSGHMLTYAFDLLYAIYEEEGYAPAEIPGLILANNLYGIEIDPRAGALAAFALTMKARAKQRTFFNKQVEPNSACSSRSRFTPDELDFLLTPRWRPARGGAFWNQFEHADTFGSLIQPDPELTARLGSTSLSSTTAAICSGRRARLGRERVVVASRVPLDRVLTSWSQIRPTWAAGTWSATRRSSRDRLPDAKQDLYAMFIERATSLLRPAGLLAMVKVQILDDLQVFEDLRHRFLANSDSSACSLGTRRIFADLRCQRPSSWQGRPSAPRRTFVYLMR